MPEPTRAVFSGTQVLPCPEHAPSRPTHRTSWSESCTVNDAVSPSLHGDGSRSEASRFKDLLQILSKDLEWLGELHNLEIAIACKRVEHREDREALPKETGNQEEVASETRDDGEGSAIQAIRHQARELNMTSAWLQATKLKPCLKQSCFTDDATGTRAFSQHLTDNSHGAPSAIDESVAQAITTPQNHQEGGDYEDLSSRNPEGFRDLMTAMRKISSTGLKNSYREIALHGAMTRRICSVEIQAAHRHILVGGPNDKKTLRLQPKGRKVTATFKDDQNMASLCWFKSILHPSSRPRLCWLICTLLALIYDILTVPLSVFNIEEEMTSLNTISLFMVIFWTSDIFMTFRTAYYVSNRLESRPCSIAVHYCKSWFFLDLAVVLMGWTSQFAITRSSDETFFKFVRVFRVLRMLRLLRIAKLRHILTSIEDMINSNVAQLGFQMSKLIAGFAIVVHFTACLWYAIGMSTDGGWPSYDTTEVSRGVLFWYATSLRWTLAQVNGRTDLDNRRNIREMIFTCIVAAGLALILMAVFISSITTAMMELGSLAEDRKKKARQINAFLKRHEISASLTALTKHNCFDARTMVEAQEEDSKILSHLPKHIQWDLLYEIRAPQLLSHPLFGCINHESKRVMWQLCNEALSEIIALKGTTVFDVNDSCQRMLIVIMGVVSYSMPGEDESDEDLSVDEVWEGLRVGRALNMGHRISEAALFMKWHNCGRLTAVALSSRFLALDSAALAQSVMHHLHVHAKAALYAHAFVEELKRQTLLSDIMDVKVDFHLR